MNPTQFALCLAILTCSIPPAIAGERGSWQVAGDTLYPELPDAEVTIRVGTTEHKAQTNQDGEFSVALARPDDDALITIEVQGSGAQHHVRAARFVGTAAHLKDSGDDSNSVRAGPVSPHSTTLYVLMEHHAGGQLPASFSALEHKLLTLPVGEYEPLLTVAAAQAAELGDLDEMADDTLELLRDPEAVVDALIHVNSDEQSDIPLYILLYELANDPALYRSVEWTWPIDFISFLPDFSAKGLNARIQSRSDSSLWLTTPDFSGSVVSDDIPCSDCITADRFELDKFDGRRLAITPPAESELVMYSGHREIYDEPEVYFETHLDRQKWGFLDASDSIDLNAVIQDATIYFPEDPELDPRSAINSSPPIHIGYRGDHLPDSGQRFSHDQEWLLPMCAFKFGHHGSPAYSGVFGDDVVQFRSGSSAYAERIGQDFRKAWDQNELVLTRDDFPTTRLRYIGNDGRSDLVLIQCSGREKEETRFTVRRAFKLPEDEIDFEQALPARFVSGLDLQTYLASRIVSGVSVRDHLWSIELYPDGTGLAGFVSSVDSTPDDFSINWYSDQNGLIHMQITHVDQELPDRSRSWQAISNSNGEMIVLESLFLEPWEELEDELTQPGRYNWYRVIPL